MIVEFFVGLQHAARARHFERCMLSYSSLRNRRKPVDCPRWIMDSGAFTEITKHGGFRDDPHVYAETINRLGQHGGLLIAVAQDWMCEPFVVAKTGLSVREHQARTIERYMRLVTLSEHPIMPVLQGYAPEEYVQHLKDYGSLIEHGARVGVGSVCKRSGNPGAIATVLGMIRTLRPDLRLHGFGVQLRALKHCAVHAMLASADSMAWSFSARHQGRNPNCWQEAMRYVDRVEAI